MVAAPIAATIVPATAAISSLNAHEGMCTW